MRAGNPRQYMTTELHVVGVVTNHSLQTSMDEKVCEIVHSFWMISMIWLLLCGCGRELSDDPIPIIFFPNAVINLSFPEYQQSLAVDGGFKVVSTVAGSSVGVRGVIIYRKDASTYLAYEVNCSFHPNEASSNVSVHSSRLYMNCTGCGSNFSFADGTPTGGVAWRPLRKYRTELSGSTLTITNEVAN